MGRREREEEIERERGRKEGRGFLGGNDVIRKTRKEEYTIQCSTKCIDEHAAKYV